MLFQPGCVEVGGFFCVSREHIGGETAYKAAELKGEHGNSNWMQLCQRIKVANEDRKSNPFRALLSNPSIGVCPHMVCLHGCFAINAVVTWEAIKSLSPASHWHPPCHHQQDLTHTSKHMKFKDVFLANYVCLTKKTDAWTGSSWVTALQQLLETCLTTSQHVPDDIKKYRVATSREQTSHLFYWYQAWDCV